MPKTSTHNLTIQFYNLEKLIKPENMQINQSGLRSFVEGGVLNYHTFALTCICTDLCVCQCKQTPMGSTHPHSHKTIYKHYVLCRCIHLNKRTLVQMKTPCNCVTGASIDILIQQCSSFDTEEQWTSKR